VSEKEIIPYQNPKDLAQFLDRPEIKIAELVAGALALGKSEAILVGGRLIQGALKGNLMKQVGREIISLQKKGALKKIMLIKNLVFRLYQNYYHLLIARRQIKIGLGR